MPVKEVTRMENVLDRAIVFAVSAHRGVFRKGTKIPYILHPLEAAAIVGTMTGDEEIIAAAVLHDVLEDTPVTVDQLRQEFGARVAALVCSESEDKRNSLPAVDTWKLRKQETLDALARETDLAVMMIALGDKLSNIRAMHNDYQKLGDRLWERFNQKDKSEHGWYYKGVAAAIIDLSSYPAWQEYTRLVSEVFEESR
jgi:myo-inositol-1(or 4)-monophosphatase